VAASNLGLILRAQGRLAEAQEFFERALAISRETGNRQREALTWGHLGILFYSQGRLGEARQNCERHLAMAREMGDRRGVAAATINLGRVLESQGRFVEARDHLERGIVACREIGDRQFEANALNNLGSLLEELDEPVAAKDRYLAAHALYEETGGRFGAAAAQLALASIARDAGDEDGARAWWSKSLLLSSQQGFVGMEALSRLGLSGLAGGDPESAEAFFKEHENELEMDEKIECRWLLWKSAGARRHLEEARRLVDENLSQLSAEDRAVALEKIRLNREIVAAAGEAGL
jgi:tetratricopeptide (TPR) repeat protein